MILIRRAREGDRRALDELCARYLPRLQRWAHGRLPASARGSVDTQDLVQLTLAKVMERIDEFEPRHEAAFQVYVRKSLRNQIVSQARHAGRQAPHDPLATGAPSGDPSPLEEAIGSELLEQYEQALERLKPEDREAIVARVEMDLSWAGVAEAIGKNSPESAQMAVSRALVRLAKEMSHAARR